MESPFTDDEITTLTMLPSLIGSAVAFSAKSGPIGTAKEMMANARAATAGKKDYPDNSIIQAIMPNFAGASEAMEVAKARQAEHAEQLQEAEVPSTESGCSASVRPLPKPRRKAASSASEAKRSAPVKPKRSPRFVPASACSPYSCRR